MFMMKTLSVAFLAFFLAVPTLSHGEEIKELMTDQEFKQFGLNKLSPEELEALSAWLDGRIDLEKKKIVAEIIPEGEDRFGATEKIQRNVERIRPEQKQITSRILGRFRGWSGGTRFKLENGQVWRQVERGKFVVNVEDPTVIIRKGFLGTYFLNVEGYGTRVKVKRVE
jgi:hypothetical protein